MHQEAMEAMQAMEHLGAGHEDHGTDGTTAGATTTEAATRLAGTTPACAADGTTVGVTTTEAPTTLAATTAQGRTGTQQQRLQYPEHAAGLLDVSDLSWQQVAGKALDPSVMQSLRKRNLDRLEQREKDKAAQKGENVAVQGETATPPQQYAAPPQQYAAPPEQCGPSPAKKGKTEEGDQDQVGD